MVYVCIRFLRCYYSNRQVMIDSEAPLHVYKATEPPTVKIREINLRSYHWESNPCLQLDKLTSKRPTHSATEDLHQVVHESAVQCLNFEAGFFMDRMADALPDDSSRGWTAGH